MSIENRLRTELDRAGQTVPIVALDIEETLTKGRRARRVAFARAAAATVVVIGLGIGGATTLINGDAEPPIPPVGDQSPRPSVTVTQEPTEEEIESVVRTWLEAVQDGDQDAAWALMTEGAHAEIGRHRFDELMGSSLPERFGTFADPNVDIEIVGIKTSEVDAGVVATMTRSRERVTQAIPLLIETGTPLVDEVFEALDVGSTVWTSASLGPRSFHAGDPLTIEAISPNVERVYLSIDGGPAQRARLDSSSGSAVVTLARALDSGFHVATIVAVEGDGRMIPNARIFEASPP
jgi:hypothetical protein